MKWSTWQRRRRSDPHTGFRLLQCGARSRDGETAAVAPAHRRGHGNVRHRQRRRGRLPRVRRSHQPAGPRRTPGLRGMLRLLRAGTAGQCTHSRAPAGDPAPRAGQRRSPHPRRPGRGLRYRRPRALQDRRVGSPDLPHSLRPGLSQHPLLADHSFFQTAEEDRAAQLRPDLARRYRGIHRDRRLPGAVQSPDRRQSGDGDRADQSGQAARARRRGLPDRPEVGIPAEGRLRREVRDLQCGRRRPRRVHEPQRDRKRPACATGGHDHRRLRDGRRRRHHLYTRGVPAGGAPPDARHRTGAAFRHPRATTAWGVVSASTYGWWKARARSSAAKRRR